MKTTINIAVFVLGLVAVKLFGTEHKADNLTEAFILLAGGFIAGLLIVLVAWGCVELYYYSQRTP